MGVRRRDVLVVVASLLIVVSCGDSGSSATTDLPLQQDALAVGADVREEARDVIKARLTEDQLRQVTEACSKPKIADQKARCVQLLKAIAESPAGPCESDDVCMTLYDASDLDSTVVAYMEITDDRCESEAGNVCLRTGLETTELLDDIVASAESTTSPDGATTPTSAGPETTPTTPSDTTSSSTSSSTSVPQPTTTRQPTSATTAPP